MQSVHILNIINIAELRAVYDVICSQDTNIYNEVIAKLYISCRDCVASCVFHK